MLATNPVHSHDASRFSGEWHLFAYRSVCWHERAIERFPFKVSIVAWEPQRAFRCSTAPVQHSKCIRADRRRSPRSDLQDLIYSIASTPPATTVGDRLPAVADLMSRPAHLAHLTGWRRLGRRRQLSHAVRGTAPANNRLDLTRPGPGGP